jgi:hypothetical protein
LRISRIVQGDAGLPRLGSPFQGAGDEVLGFAVGSASSAEATVALTTRVSAACEAWKISDGGPKALSSWRAVRAPTPGVCISRSQSARSSGGVMLDRAEGRCGDQGWVKRSATSTGSSADRMSA